MSFNDCSVLCLISQYITDVNKLVFGFGCSSLKSSEISIFATEIVESLKQPFIENKTDTVQTSPHSI